MSGIPKSLSELRCGRLRHFAYLGRWQNTQHLPMKTRLLGITALAIMLAGCTTSDFPRGARLVGGGLKIEYTAPSDGTAILKERTSGKIVATESLGEGNTFHFSPNHEGCSEVLFSLFAPTNTVYEGGFPPMPTNTFFELYFVPEKARSE